MAIKTQEQWLQWHITSEGVVSGGGGGCGIKPGSPQQLSRVTSVGQQAAKPPCLGCVNTKIGSTTATTYIQHVHDSSVDLDRCLILVKGQRTKQCSPVGWRPHCPLSPNGKNSLTRKGHGVKHNFLLLEDDDSSRTWRAGQEEDLQLKN